MSNSNQIKLRTPGKLVYERPQPKLRLVQSEEQQKPVSKTECSEEVKEMLRDMNRRRAVAKGSNTPDAA